MKKKNISNLQITFDKFHRRIDSTMKILLWVIGIQEKTSRPALSWCYTNKKQDDSFDKATNKDSLWERSEKNEHFRSMGTQLKNV